MILWIILFFILLFFFKTKEGMSNSSKNIPANIFQTWNSKNLPPNMKACVSRLKRQNPKFKHSLYDDDDCRNFIVEYFDSDVVDAFDRLIPGAYKADLWRYCVLYIKGGIYIDIKFECCEGFTCEELLDKSHYVLDRQEHAEPGNSLVYNGVMVSPSNNPVLLTCIKRIVSNVQNQEFGYNPLYPTGPGLLGEVLGKNTDIDLSFSSDAKYILFGKRQIFQVYPEYREEQQKIHPGKSYHDLWKKGIVYQP
jgi:mannosyltransferase OCH1-like enzyme